MQCLCRDWFWLQRISQVCSAFKPIFARTDAVILRWCQADKMMHGKLMEKADALLQVHSLPCSLHTTDFVPESHSSCAHEDACRNAMNPG
eukprot:1537734-Rhodomonas_salina.3